MSYYALGRRSVTPPVAKPASARYCTYPPAIETRIRTANAGVELSCARAYP
jgi:hypothetical protein